MIETTPTLIAAAAALALLPAIARRLQLSLAKHRSLTGHTRMARRVARWLPAVRYAAERCWDSDGAPPAVAAQREAALLRLGALYGARFPLSLAATDDIAAGLSDLQFTARYRVPFQFADVVRRHLRMPAVMASSSGVTLTDLDGNVLYDLTGSYGVNVLGNDAYKQCIADGAALAQPLGPVLGSLHPVVARNVERLRRISQQDAVSFHMSGTEAVMQAVRLARYHTGRSHVVRFCGAYHGWWEDVQPGPGNPVTPRQTYTLKEMDAATLRVLRTRRDIACVLVNPLQALHPNRAAPADSALMDSSRRAGTCDRAAYADWLHRLRQVCSERGIVLIFDEVFVGFRLAPGGAQEHFGIRADLVTYGKTLGGGLPVGVVCGSAALMQRFRSDRPADICFARGTFNAHPYVMGAMDAFLSRMEEPQTLALYDGLDARWDARRAALNQRLADAGLPVLLSNLSTIWTVGYTRPSRYNWMLQYYLRGHGLALSWVGTGRIVFSLNYSDADFAAVADRFVAACREMHGDGWWWHDAALTDRAIRRRVLRELLGHRWRRSTQANAAGVSSGRSARRAAAPAARGGTAGCRGTGR